MRYLLGLAFIIAIAAYLCGPIIDPDLFWHIVAGRWIISNQALPQTDHWSLFGYGSPWRAYSWLFEIVVAFLENFWSFTGLYFFKLLVIISLAGSLSYCASRLAKDWFFGTMLGALGAAACFNHLTLRPQLIVWSLFVWLLFFAERVLRDGAKWKTLIPIVLVMALWANLHITTVLGVAAVYFWMATRSSHKIALQAVLAAFIGTLITPYLGGEWITFISKSGHPFQYSAIAEFQPASIVQHSTAFPLLLLAILALFFFQAPKAIEPGKYLFCALLMLAGFAIVKFLPFAVVFTCMMLAYAWGKVGKQSLGNFAEGIERLKNLIFKVPPQGLTFVLICWTIVSVHSRLKRPLDPAVVPVDALDFITQHKLPLPLMNDFGSGGYVMYRLSDRSGELPSPAHRVAIDGRTNVAPAEINEKFLKAFYGRAGWGEFVAAVKPESVLWKSESPLVSILLNGQEWCRVFSSGTDVQGFSVLLKRKYLETGAANPPAISCQ